MKYWVEESRRKEGREHRRDLGRILAWEEGQGSDEWQREDAAAAAAVDGDDLWGAWERRFEKQD